ncbi:MAG: alpha/beta hydrolase [Ruminiclostridium sp.]|nr:alpha/beta hydrolase [Ruminiclostridium sp.]
MSANLKGGDVIVGGTKMSYVSFGHGDKTLVFLPGLSDGLVTVRGKAILLYRPYRLFFDKFTVYIFSRKDDMPDGYSISDMAADQAAALRALGIEKACIAGISQGGMISQHLAAGFPELVEKLVLAVTAPYANETVRNAVSGWIKMAEDGDHKRLMLDTAEKTYSDRYLEKNKMLLPLHGMIGKPKSYRRFLINANAILDYDARDILGRITCPTLIIGGGRDKTVGTEAAYELHDGIAGSELYIYPEIGHGVWEHDEAPDFNKRIFDFLEK